MKKKNAEIIPFSAARGNVYDAAKEKEENIIGFRIAEARKRKGFSIATFSDYLENFGVKISTGGAGKWETGYSVPSAYQLLAICHALEITEPISFFTGSYVPPLNERGLNKVDEYRDDLIASGKYRPALQQGETVRLIEMPVSDLAVSAGTGNFLGDGNFEMYSFPEDEVPSGADFGIRVSGDSMEPVYHNGQIVWVKECEQIDIGQVGVFIYDGEGFLKVYSEREPDESEAETFTDSYGTVHPQPVLESYNPKYPPRPIRPEALFKIVGRVL